MLEEIASDLDRSVCWLWCLLLASLSEHVLRLSFEFYEEGVCPTSTNV